jgi:hypothetical protein
MDIKSKKEQIILHMQQHEIPYLKQLSGLDVIGKELQNNYAFVFRFYNRDIFTCFTYQKAKAFAKGFNLGRTLRT